MKTIKTEWTNDGLSLEFVEMDRRGQVEPYIHIHLEGDIGTADIFVYPKDLVIYRDDKVTSKYSLTLDSNNK